MEPQSLGLEDIITPATVNGWPPAPGWWLLALAVAAGLWLLAWGIKAYRQHWGYRRQALKLLEQAYRQAQSKSGDNLCASLCVILKRTAITAYPAKGSERSIGSLHGNEWLAFLNAQVKQPLFTDELADIINHGQYQPRTDMDIEGFYTACSRWIKQHKTHRERP